MSHISFNVAARCEKAGRASNQDALLVCPDVANMPDEAFVGTFDTGTLYEQSAAGTLLVVADGMGGMNAGEKASELVIEGIKSMFSNVPAECLGNVTAAIKFMNEAVRYADSLIKDYARRHPETRGMGSTIAMVWLLGDSALCSWCGDSRIYRFNPANGLARLSHDHSYVQNLVDTGKIDPEDAFDHPDSNIITRSMGDSGEEARPESAIYDVYENDIFLLCSDGLCGLLPDPRVSDLLRDNAGSVSEAMKALWMAGEQERWTDNSTIVLCGIVRGGKRAPSIIEGYPEVVPARRPAAGKGASGTRGNSKLTSYVTFDDDSQVAAQQPVTAGKKKKWAAVAMTGLVVLTGAWIGLPYIFPGQADSGSRGSTVASGTIDPAEAEDAIPATSPDKEPSAPARRGGTDGSAQPAPRPSVGTDDENATPNRGTKSVDNSTARKVDKFVGKINTLSLKIPEVQGVMRSGGLTEMQEKYLKEFVSEVVALVNEYNSNKLEIEKVSLDNLNLLNKQAEAADAYIKRFTNYPKVQV